VVSDDQEYSVGIADAANKELEAKGVAVQRDQFAQSASDYSSTIAKIKAYAPQVIFFGGYYAQGGRLLKQIRDAGLTSTFATGDGSLDPGWSVAPARRRPRALSSAARARCPTPSQRWVSEEVLGDYQGRYHV